MIASPRSYRRAWSVLAALSIVTLGLFTLTDATTAAQPEVADGDEQPDAPARATEQAPPPAAENEPRVGGAAAVGPAEGGRSFKDMPVLDLTGWSAEQIAEIDEIQDIAVVLVDEGARPALAGAQMKDVASVVPLPEGAEKRVMMGQLKLPASTFAPKNAEETTLILAGQVVVTEAITQITYDQVIIIGQAIIHGGGEAAMGEKLSLVSGQMIYTKATPRVIFGEDTLDREFFEINEAPMSLVVFGELNLAEDVTAGNLREHVASIHVFGEVTANRELHATIRQLTQDMFGDLSER